MVDNARLNPNPSSSPPATLSGVQTLHVEDDGRLAGNRMWACGMSGKMIILSAAFSSVVIGRPSDPRIVVYGLRYYIENYLCCPEKHGALLFANRKVELHSTEPAEFGDIAKLESWGTVPVRVYSLPEGSVAFPGQTVLRIEAALEHASIARNVASVLSLLWYPCAVATLARRTRDVIAEAYMISVDDALQHTVDTRLRDFGMRGCNSVEQCVIGGSAHLLSFCGTSTLAAAFSVQYLHNRGTPIGAGIPSTEHSVIMSWPSELEAFDHILSQYGHGVLSCVLDTYDYTAALKGLVPKLKEKKEAMGGTMVLRPDSGDPVETVILGLRATENVFGARLNSKGFKVFDKCGVLQGDGVDFTLVGDILHATMEAGFSAECVAFGMGSGLLQKVNDSMVKLEWKEEVAMITDAVETGAFCSSEKSAESMQDRAALVLHFDGTCMPSRVQDWESFDLLRIRVSSQWEELAIPLQKSLKP